MPDPFYGVEFVESTIGSATVQELKAGVGMLVGTAPTGEVHDTAEARAKRINKTIQIRSREDAAAHFGPHRAGFTIPAALDAIFDQAGPKGVGVIDVVNVFDPDTHASVGEVTNLDTIGTFTPTGEATGLKKAYEAYHRFGRFPKIVMCPGFAGLTGVRGVCHGVNIEGNQFTGHVVDHSRALATEEFNKFVGLTTVGGSAGHAFTGKIRRNHFRYLFRGTAVELGLAGAEITDNLFEFISEDCVNPSWHMENRACTVSILRNIFRYPLAVEDGGHSDYIQFGGAADQTDIPNKVIEQNLMLCDMVTTPKSAQGAVGFGTLGNSVFTGIRVRGNLFMTNHYHGVRFDYVDGGDISHNVVVPPPSAGNFPGVAFISAGIATGGALPLMHNNIATNVQAQADNAGSIAAPADGLETLFVGPNFAPTTIEGLVAAYTSAPGV